MKYLLIVLLVVLAGCNEGETECIKEYWRMRALQHKLEQKQIQVEIDNLNMNEDKPNAWTQWDTLWVDSIPYIQTVRLDTFLINADIHHSDYGKSFRKQEIK